jgi:hypothetical protein
MGTAATKDPITPKHIQPARLDGGRRWIARIAAAAGADVECSATIHLDTLVILFYSITSSACEE